MFSWDFLDTMRSKSIDEGSIMEYINNEGAKRICFASTHNNALRMTEGKETVKAWLNLPFADTIEPIMKKIIGSDFSLCQKPNGNGFYYRVLDDDILNSIKGFMEHYKDIVFLRDNLDLSVALSMHEVEDNIRTPIGENEYQVKYNPNNKDTSAELSQLTEELGKRLNELPYYEDANFICAIPSSKPFVGDIISSLDGWKEKDISNHLCWKSKGTGIKNIETAEEKLQALKNYGLDISDIDLTGKTVVLVDDLYKSGLTMQYVAMKLKEAGAKYVFGICLVKALGNK